MRRLLFKGFHESDGYVSNPEEIKISDKLVKGEWYFGGYVHEEKCYGTPCDRHYIVNEDTVTDDLFGDKTEVTPESICQFTCFSDSEGKPIYENDLVIYNGYLLKVIYDSCGWLCKPVNNKFLPEKGCPLYEIARDCVVIGNIFKNENLVKNNQEDINGGDTTNNKDS